MTEATNDAGFAVVWVQEANRILPGQSEILSMCSKAWSDMTYLDEIHRLPHKEVLTDEQKRDVNTKAISYCEQVRHLQFLQFLVFHVVQVGHLWLPG